MCTALGPIASPQGYLGQLEGGAVIGLGMCLFEELECEGGHYLSRNLDSYFVPSIKDAPSMELMAIENLPPGDSIGPRGAGEIGVNLVVPAIANALGVALQKPVTRLPMTPLRVIALLEESDP